MNEIEITRPYENKDNEALNNMLTCEGIIPAEMAYTYHITFVMEEKGLIKGFFTIKYEHGYPSIQHFCTGRIFRSAAMARALIKAMKEKVSEMGFSKMILHSKKDVTDKFIAYYFKTKPYAIIGTTTYYFVNI